MNNAWSAGRFQNRAPQQLFQFQSNGFAQQYPPNNANVSGQQYQYNQYQYPFNSNYINPNNSYNNTQNNFAQQNNQFQTYYSNPKTSKKSDKIKQEEPKKDQKEYGQNTGIYWKLKGNQLYKASNYEMAIKCYTKAIQLDPSQSIFFSNRSQCYKQLHKYHQSLNDAQQSVQLDLHNIPGNILVGLNLVEIGKLQDSVHKLQKAIVRFTKALTLNGKKNIDLEREVIKYIYLSRKILFYIKQKQRQNLMKAELAKYKNYVQNDDKLNKQEKAKQIQQFTKYANKQYIFQIPEHLLCRITLELMQDPVITNSGQAYERSAIEDHMRKNGLLDPMTRAPIQGTLYSCVNIKKAIQSFLIYNPWAYQFKQDQYYKNVFL